MSTRKSPLLILIPLVGIGLFLALYVVATQAYPGGSQESKMTAGFSWMHNYWCNLLNEIAINGQPNSGRLIAMLAMVILCGSLLFFFYHLPTLFTAKGLEPNLIRLPGMLSAFLALFIFTEQHDSVINFAAFFGFIALVGTFRGLYKARLSKLLVLGVLCLFMMALNNYLYFATNKLYYLPLVQKITFICVLLWISSLTIAIYKHRTRT